MSIRKVSDLPIYSFSQINVESGGMVDNRPSSFYMLPDTIPPNRLGQSLFEISEVEEGATGADVSRFTSRYITYEQLWKDVTHNILYEDTQFDGNKTFVGNKIHFDNSDNGEFILNYKNVNLSADNDFNICGNNTTISSNISTIIYGGNNSEGGVYISSENDICNICSGEYVISSKNDISIGSPTSVYIQGDDIILSAKTNVIISSEANDLSFMVDVNGKMEGAWLDKETGRFVFTQDISGCAMSARWADLAEHYAADGCYLPGTLMQFGGEYEVTKATTEVNAVVSNKPAYVMNCNNSYTYSTPLVMVGRTPVRVAGPVKKFDKLVLSDIPGIARVRLDGEDNPVIAVALESDDDVREHLVQCTVQLRLC